MDKIIDMLFSMQDEKYRDFQAKLLPTVDAGNVIGVRTPDLRKLAKQMVKEDDGVQDFLHELPHKYFDENQLHAFILSEMKDFDSCLDEVCRFLPFVDNWATCDQMSPKVFKKHKMELLEYIKNWIMSEETYTVRFAIGMLMEHFLGDEYDVTYSDLVATVSSEDYYVNMMRAWYFATGLAKHYDNMLQYLEGRALDVWTHNKTIQKAVESYRIGQEQKNYLKSLKISCAETKTVVK